jgi:hypothetical protein
MFCNRIPSSESGSSAASLDAQAANDARRLPALIWPPAIVGWEPQLSDLVRWPHPARAAAKAAPRRNRDPPPENPRLLRPMIKRRILVAESLNISYCPRCYAPSLMSRRVEHALRSRRSPSLRPLRLHAGCSPGTSRRVAQVTSGLVGLGTPINQNQ